MKHLRVQNLTNETQKFAILEGIPRKFHTVSIVPQGSVEIPVYQVTRDLESKVDLGILKVIDPDTGKEFSLSPKVEKSEETVTQTTEQLPNPEVTEQETKSEDSEVPEQNPTVDEHVCDICGEKFDTARALSSHKRVHK